MEPNSESSKTAKPGWQSLQPNVYGACESVQYAFISTSNPTRDSGKQCRLGRRLQSLRPPAEPFLSLRLLELLNHCSVPQRARHEHERANPFISKLLTGNNILKRTHTRTLPHKRSPDPANRQRIKSHAFSVQMTESA